MIMKSWYSFLTSFTFGRARVSWPIFVLAYDELKRFVGTELIYISSTNYDYEILAYV